MESRTEMDLFNFRLCFDLKIYLLFIYLFYFILCFFCFVAEKKN